METDLTLTSVTRTSERVPVREPIRIRRTNGSGKEYGGVSTDISVSGIRTIVETSFQIDEVVELRFIAPKYRDSACYRARVVYCYRAGEYGLYLLRSW
jgi:hypothetical protein